jgi:hypothetical protein
MEFPIGLFYGLMIGLGVSLILYLLLGGPVARDGQFKKDCVAMAHGKMSNHLCVKGDKILFHQ